MWRNNENNESERDSGARLMNRGWQGRGRESLCKQVDLVFGELECGNCN